MLIEKSLHFTIVLEARSHINITSSFLIVIGGVNSMYRNRIKSWSIIAASDISLNFALFVGCLNGLIENDEINEIKLWPSECSSDIPTELLSLLKEEWKQWFNFMLKARWNKVILKQEFELESNIFAPPNFPEFPYEELKEYCKNAWKPFIEWWEMVGGCQKALLYIEGIDNNKIYKYIDEFENIVQRKVKPFNLYIDLVYTGSSKIIDVNNEYIIMVPTRPIYFDKAWWMSKLQQIG